MSTTPPPPPPGQSGGPQGPSGSPHGQPSPSGTSWQDASDGQHYAQQPWPGPGHPMTPPLPQPPEQKRSWFARHKILTGLLAVIGLFIVIGALGGGGDDTPAATPTPAQTTPTQETRAAEEGDDEPAAEEPAAEEPAAPATAAPAPEEAAADDNAAAEEPTQEGPAPDSPGLNDAVRDGQFEFIVTQVETGLETVGEGFSEEEAQGQFVMIHIEVTNIGDRAQTMFDSAQILIDDQGRQHETSSASIWLDEGLWLDDINPGNSVEGVLLYDIPTDAEPTSLELHDSMFSGGVSVSLQ